MVHQSTKQERDLDTLTALYEAIGSGGDFANAEKMKQLMVKIYNQEFIIAFCGHFSAGKSSMINYLLGEQVLPSSPIPTSANTVKLQRGENYAKVYFFQGKPVLFPAPYDYRAVKKFAKDGESISSITISSSEFPLPETCTVMDTPGIDSTDDAHRVATESALHLANAIFYVMDYNHVQSEVNFQFAKDLMDAGKQVYLIINQIDKHDETELGFINFKSSVSEAFANWGVYPNEIFYTSLRDLQNEENQIEQVKEFIFKQVQMGEDTRSVFDSAERLLENHLLWLKEKLQEENTSAFAILADLPLEDRERITDRLLSLNEEKSRITFHAGSVQEKFEAGLETTLKNAYIMPAQTRDLAKAYLESNQPEFKIGLLFSRKKTEEERVKRQQAILNDLQEKVKTKLEWHLKELAVNTLSEADIHNSSLEQAAQGIEVTVTEQMLASSLKQQVNITGEYVLNYTNELAASIKKEARNQADGFLQELHGHLKKRAAEKIGTIENELAAYIRYQSAFESIRTMKDNLEHTKKALFDLLTNKEIPSSNLDSIQMVTKWIKEDDDAIIKHTDEIEPAQSAGTSQQKNNRKDVPVQQPAQDYHVDKEATGIHGKDRLKKTAANLTNASNLIQPLKGFHSLYRELKEKAERLESQTFTVALFGAFSAGKSSFANALMGENVLPVSPNPTTAAINKILASTADHPHGTATVTLKSADMLLEDVALALSAYDLTARTLEQAYQLARELLKESAAEERGKTHLSFIRAFYQGLPEYQEKLGTKLSVDLDGFRSFAAVESKSCFVDLIELYFDCELTKQGMVLVDTPGADSINARHTGAAFEYIKNSDAILFVTYYNHPFSRADREFLIQLGRVKDSFAMDKMFFIVNAVDLADTSDELEEVMAYVKEHLSGFGIRFPKLFPMSSKGALVEKNAEIPFQHKFLPDSGLEAFQTQFDRFIEHDLTTLALASSKGAILRARQLLGDVIAASKQDERAKQKALAGLDQELLQLKEILSGLNGETEKQRLRKEIEELVFYSKQRVFLRFADFFKESFNPAVIKDDGRDLKAVLQKSLREFFASLGFDLAQEMRATALRSELFVGRLLLEKQTSLDAKGKQIRESLSLREPEALHCETLEFKQAFEDLHVNSFKKELALFKNTKSFFEKNEKAKMSDALQEGLEQPAASYTAAQQERMYSFYSTLFDEELQKLQQEYGSEINEIYSGLRSALEEIIDIPLYEGILEEIKQLT
ncbi:Dynamin family protein [Peribacillus cavernae]|uniref:Dynamin family protein n=1 Tax=Peribacillus cavernae TaxID=1674310 RepID=A0A433HKK8_9BACI|nr:dynamin family protein [Peribacillus cavernae]MDQ0218018.1 small GTP-binding protein [Peribacillus cavernae]RUQ28937.1 Dynamin family protein [Peribacillus cavernae]